MPTSSNGKHPRSRGRTGAKFLHLRRRLLKDGAICQFKGNDLHPSCGELIDPTVQWPNDWAGTINHKIPVADLAWDDPLLWDPENCEPFHDICNKRNGSGKSQNKSSHPNSRDWFD